MDEKYTNIQSLLLKWFRHHGIRSIPQIRIACRSLNESFSTDRKYPLYSFFFPLVRKGHLEYMGNEKYHPAPPVVILNKKDNISTALNLSHVQIAYIKNIYKVDGPDSFGTIRLKKLSRNLKEICRELHIDIIDNRIACALGQFPSLKDVIMQFRREPEFQCSRRYNVFKKCWEYDDENDCVGIYKLTEEARQYYFRMDQEGWLKIPSLRINPDSEYICKSYQAVHNKERPCIFYKKAEKILFVRSISLPILVDRILRIPSVHMKRCVEKEYPNISFTAYRQLNRIFSNGIKIK